MILLESQKKSKKKVDKVKLIRYGKRQLEIFRIKFERG